ncbi:hypothetical protein, partial [Alistipes finegoldii]|uniref:hypothetical protein n=1 Tax=Alistipes finegoldii TaxID=214856 RepID=UPI003563A624
FFVLVILLSASEKRSLTLRGGTKPLFFISYIFYEIRTGCMSTRRYSCGRRAGAMKCDGIWSSAVSIITVHSA